MRQLIFEHIADDVICLRRLHVDDLTRFQAYRGDPDTGRFQGWVATSDQEANEFLLQMHYEEAFRDREWFQIGVADSLHGPLLGDLGVRVDREGDLVEIGYTIASEARGKGRASAAIRLFQKELMPRLGVRNLLAQTDARNLPSVRVLEGCGFQRVEVRNAVFRDEACIEYIYLLAC